MSIFAILGIAVQTVEIKPIVGTVPAVLRQIAVSTGSEVRWGPEVANDVIGISVPSASRQDVFDQIAFAVDGEWKVDRGIPVLRRSADVAKAQAEVHAERMANMVAAKFSTAKSGPELDRQGAAALAASIVAVEREIAVKDEVGQSFEITSERFPSRRLLTALVSLMKPLDVARIQSGKRKVYSSKPNRLQHPFPGPAREIIERYQRESALLREAWQDSGSEVRYFVRPPVRTEIKVVLSIDRSSPRYLRFDLEILNSNLARIDAASVFVHLEPDWNREPIRDETPVERTVREGHLEPLVPVVMDGLVALSSKSSVPFVMAIPDGIVYQSMAWMAIPKPTLGQFQSFLLSEGVAEVPRKEWRIFKERDPHLGRLERLDRVLMAKYLRASGDTHLDAFAELAVKHVPPLEDTCVTQLGFFAGWRELPIHHAPSQVGYARLYGTLTPAQRLAVNLGFRDLTSKQRQILSDFLIGRKLLSARAQPLIKGDTGVATTYETTELFPNGLAEPLAVLGSVDEQPSLFGLGDRRGSVSAVSPAAMAGSLFTKERPDLFPPGRYATYRAYAEGAARTWGASIRLSSLMVTSGSLTDNRIGPFGPLESLSRASHEAVNAELARLREQYKNVKRAGGGGASVHHFYLAMPGSAGSPH